MNVIMIPQDTTNNDFRFRVRLHLFSAGMTDAQLIYYSVKNTNVGVYPVTGTGRAEYTISSTTDIMNDVAVWLPWPLGDVSVPTVDTQISNATCVRFVCTQECDFEISST